MGQKWVETHFSPTSNPFRDLRKKKKKNTHFSASLRVVEIVLKKGPEAVPTQHKPRNPAVPLLVSCRWFHKRSVWSPPPILKK